MQKWMWQACLFILLLPSLAMAAQNQLRIDGTGDSQDVLRALGAAFEVANPGTRIIVPDSVGSRGGIKALLKGLTDMARTARPLKEDEKKQGPDIQSRLFARSAVVFFSNQPHPCVTDLSTEQVLGLFSGTIRNWDQLGHCPDHRIYLALREEGDSSRNVIEEGVSGLKDINKPTGQIIYTTPETVETVVSTPYTLAYTALGAVEEHPVQIMSFNGIAPNPENVAKGIYPLSSPFSLVWRGELTGLGKRFIAFVFAPEGQKVIRSFGLVPVPGR